MAGRAARSTAGGPDVGRGTDDPLAPYVPRLVVDWLLDEPEREYRAVPGSFVFADISGFTALTERLAAAGRVGAEEMADLLNGAFGQLLTAAYDFGASLIKWGGDAVLLLFDGPGHVARSVNAAWSMQTVMRRIGRLQTSRGVVRLGMSIGAHTGELDLLLVGGGHRELVVTGPAATTTAHMEKIASRGEVVVSAAVATQLPDRCIGRPVEDGFLLVRPPEVAMAPNRSVKRQVDLSRAMCASLERHLGAGRMEHEHRFVTTGFLQFVGADRLLAEQGEHALTDAIRHLFDSVEQAATANDVTFLASDIAEDGGKIMLAAGAPHSAGDDETRMLATMRRVVYTGGRLDLKAGVTSGSVFAGDFGPFYRRTYSVAGDSVNLAARLAAHARPGQVITTPRVVERSRTRFELTPLPPFAAKGKALPVEAVAVGEVRRSSEPVGRARLRLVGRERELARLLAANDSAATGRGVVVDLVGAAGIGKSRLIEELTARVDVQTMWADGDIYGRTTPYQPMQRLLRTTLGLPADVDQETVVATLRDLVAGTAPDLAPYLPLIAIPAGVDVPSTPEVDLLDPDVRRERLEAVTSDLLGRLLPGPIVLVLNDVHFMDDATLGLVRRLAEDAVRRKWLIVGTRRPGSDAPVPDAPHVVRIELEPLDGAAAAELVAAATSGVALPEHRRRGLAERAGGNPMFLTQLAAAAAASGVDALPDTVEAVVNAQIDRLPPRRRRWLRAASVLGMAFDPDVLRAVLADTDLAGEDAEGLEEFIAPNVDGRLRFTHHLTRWSAYEGLPYRRRTELHARTAQILEQRLGRRAEEEAALLSLHSFEGARFEPAWRYARVAGDRARERYAPVEAAECYRRALAAAAKLAEPAADQVADVYESLAEVCLDLGEMDAAEAALRQARSRARHDPLRGARLHLATARHRYFVGRHTDALRWISRGRSLLGASEDVDARRLMARLAERAAEIRYDQAAYRAGLVWAQRAVDEARRAGDAMTEAHAIGLASMLRAAAGLSVDEATMRHAMQLLERSEDHRGRSRAGNLFGMCAYFQGRWDSAIAFYADAEQTARTTGREHDVAAGAVNRAEVLVQQGRTEEAELAVGPAIRVLVGANATTLLGFATMIYGRVALAKGDYDAAMDRLGEARRMSIDMGEIDDALSVDALIAETLLRAGSPEDALSHLDGALAQLAALGADVNAAPAVLRVRGEALIAAGRDGGADALRESLAAARGRTMLGEVERTLRALLLHELATTAEEELAWQEESARLVLELGIVDLPSERVLFPETDVVCGITPRTTSV